MRKMMINGLRVGSDPQTIQGRSEGIVLRGVINTSQKMSGEWKEIPHWISVFFTGALKDRITAMKVKKGSTLAVTGNYALSVNETEKGPMLNISVFADSVEYSTGSIGTTGTLSVFCTDMGLCADLNQFQSGGGYVDAAYNTGFGENKQTEYLRLVFSAAPNALVQKGKRIDVIGKWDVNLVSKDGKNYINQTIYVGSYNKSPFVPKNDAQTAPAPVPAVAAAPVQSAAGGGIDLADFEEIGDDTLPF